MTQYIDKDALVEYIRQRYIEHQVGNQPIGCLDRMNEDKDILSYLNTLEVKEVDLESKQRMRECPCRQVVCTMYTDKMLECNGACSWVVDYPRLKKFKAQKGE